MRVIICDGATGLVVFPGRGNLKSVYTRAPGRIHVDITCIFK